MALWYNVLVLKSPIFPENGNGLGYNTKPFTTYFVMVFWSTLWRGLICFPMVDKEPQVHTFCHMSTGSLSFPQNIRKFRFHTLLVICLYPMYYWFQMSVLLFADGVWQVTAVVVGCRRYVLLLTDRSQFEPHVQGEVHSEKNSSLQRSSNRETLPPDSSALPLHHTGSTINYGDYSNQALLILILSAPNCFIEYVVFVMCLWCQNVEFCLPYPRLRSRIKYTAKFTNSVSTSRHNFFT